MSKRQLAKPETQAGRESWAIICTVVCPSLPYGASKTEIKFAAYAAFRVGDDFPQGRIDESSLKRCGWATKAAIEARARELGLRLPEGHNGTKNTAEPCADDEEYLQRLRSTEAMLLQRYRDPQHPLVVAMRMELQHLSYGS